MLKTRDVSTPAREPEADDRLLSVIIPVYNEEANLEPLHKGLVQVLSSLGRDYEIIYVDDGSTDGSLAKLKALVESDSSILAIQLRRNFGQTAAMSAGIDHARGGVFIFMDADLQNDPKDIPNLIDMLDKGYDLVSGWRKDRKDNWLWRRLPSVVANRIISFATGVHLHDYGCTLKAYRRDVFDHVRLYGEMHRFVPAYAKLVGASVAEIPVGHHERIHGTSKYGIGRTFRVILDLFTVKFLSSFSGNPIYLFGGSGLVLIALSAISGVVMVFNKLIYGISLINTPLLLLSTLLFILGFHSILLGLTAELLIRTYHESQGKPIYFVRRMFRSSR